jgi:hypothetical protein
MNKKQQLMFRMAEFHTAIHVFAFKMSTADLDWMAANGRFTPGMAMAFERYVEACKSLMEL